MRSNKALVLVALAMTFFFLAQFAAELSFEIFPVPAKSTKLIIPGLGLKSLSLSGRLHTDAAFAMLEAGSNLENSEAAVKMSMQLLRQSLKRNPLDYQARYYLAKAYLRFSAINNDYFDLGVRELKRAASIRGGNKHIVLDCAKVFFSLWPLLDKQDQDFVIGLLSGVMPALNWGEFTPIVELWGLYVQDIPLLMKLLRLKPNYFGPSANQLAASGMPLAMRWEMLALHEAHALDDLERQYNLYSLRGGIGMENAQSLLGQARAIRGFHRLHAGSGFDTEKYAKLRRTLLIDVITGLLPGKDEDPKKAAQLRELIEFYIVEHSGLSDLDELQKLLVERGYFKENDFPSLRLKTTIAFMKANHGSVITEIEALRKGISFVKKEQTVEYTAILLLLVDSYYSSKLMTAAEAVVQELYREQPDNPDVLWRVLRVQKIMGNEGAPDKAMDEKLAVVENSRFVTVVKANAMFDVFLFNQPQIEIAVDPTLHAKLKPGQMFQVFVDGKIAFESYVDGLPEKIVIGAPFVEIERKVKVQIAVL